MLFNFRYLSYVLKQYLYEFTHLNFPVQSKSLDLMLWQFAQRQAKDAFAIFPTSACVDDFMAEIMAEDKVWP